MYLKCKDDEHANASEHASVSEQLTKHNEHANASEPWLAPQAPANVFLEFVRRLQACDLIPVSQIAFIHSLGCPRHWVGHRSHTTLEQLVRTMQSRHPIATAVHCAAYNS